MSLNYKRQLPVPIRYDDIVLESGLRLDVFVEECVIVELKSVESMIPLFHAQLLSHLKLCDQRLGLLINFNVKLLKDGIKRIVN